MVAGLVWCSDHWISALAIGRPVFGIDGAGTAADQCALVDLGGTVGRKWEFHVGFQMEVQKVGRKTCENRSGLRFHLADSGDLLFRLPRPMAQGDKSFGILRELSFVISEWQ